MIFLSFSTPKARLLFCVVVVSMFHTVLSAQSLRDAPYYSPDENVVRQKLADETAASILLKFREPEKFDKEAKKAYQGRRERMTANIVEEISESAIPDEVLWPFVKKTQATIVAANPQCAGTKIILTIDPIPNAYSIGEGTIVVYSGLLAGLENEDQLAFVLCHEMAHYLLEHATNGLVKEIKTYYSKEFKEQVKAASAVEFNRNEKLESVFKNALFSSRYHRRDLERQADSLAYRLFLKTPYAPAQAQRLMQLFEYMDEPLRDSSLDISRHFGCVAYPFQPNWLEKAQGSVWGAAQSQRAAAEKPLEDSLSTHPDWQNRLRWLETIARSSSPDDSKIPAPESQYAPIKYLSALESVDAWFNLERYDQSLYYAMQYQQVYPACTYFQEIQALSLYGLYAHSKEHSLADVLAESAPDNPEKYNRFLDFLNNLRLKDLLALQKCSVEALPAPKTEYALLAAYCLALSQEDHPAMTTIRREYLSTYRKGRFVDFFKN